MSLDSMSGFVAPVSSYFGSWSARDIGLTEAISLSHATQHSGVRADDTSLADMKQPALQETVFLVL